MNKIKETNHFAEKSQENTEVEIPTFCPSCLNHECVELIDEGDEQDADGVFGNYHFRCSVCGRRTDSMDTPADALESWQSHEVNCLGSCAILMPIKNLRKLCKDSKGCCRICQDCGKAGELRKMY